MVSAMAFSANRSRRSSRYQRISFQPACFKSRRRSPRSPNCDRDQSTALFSTTPVSLRVFIDLRHLTHHPIIPLHSGCDPLSPHSAVVKRPARSPLTPNTRCAPRYSTSIFRERCRPESRQSDRRTSQKTGLGYALGDPLRFNRV